MKIILQRVSGGGLVINGGTAVKMGQGLVALVGFCHEDTKEIVDYMMEKLINLRIFDDENGNLNLSLLDIGGSLMVVPNFTLYANSKKGRRPSFVGAAPPVVAVPLYDYFLAVLSEKEIPIISGEFGANMQVEIHNDGPVTIDLDSDELR